MPNVAIVLPWVSLKGPLSVGHVTIRPFTDAVNVLTPQQRQNLRAILASFADVYSSCTTDEGRPEPTSSVILADYWNVADEPDTSEIDDGVAAVHALMFATIAENRPVFCANGATFEYEPHFDLDRPLAVRVQQQMEGWTFNAFDPSATLRVKPWHVGAFHYEGDAGFTGTLMAWRGAQPSLVDLLFSALRGATSDSPDVKRPIALALYAKAIALAASAPGDDDRDRFWVRGSRRSSRRSSGPRPRETPLDTTSCARGTAHATRVMRPCMSTHAAKTRGSRLRAAPRPRNSSRFAWPTR